MKRDTTKRDLERRRANMRTDRSQWETRWKKIQEVVAPVFGYFDTNETGKRKWGALYNSTPLYCVQVLSAGLQSGLTSPHQQWYHLSSPNPQINKMLEVRRYCSQCEEVINADMLSCGMYDAFANCYSNLGAFGTGGFLVVEDTKKPFACITCECGEYYLAQDWRGTINEFMRTIKMTPAQIIEQFGSKAPECVERAFNGDERVEFEVHQLVTPNDGRIAGKRGIDGANYLSFYWMSEGDEILSVGFYEEMPFIGGRWYQIGRDVYGYGPGETIYGDAAQLQAMEKDKTTARQLLIQPPMQIPTALKGKFSMLPGSKNYYDPQGAQGASQINSLLNLNFDIGGVMQDIAVTEQRIKRAFFTELFMAVLDRSTDNPQKTATEIQEMIAEKSSMIGPVLQRLDREILRPAINRVYGIEARLGRLPEPPEILNGQELTVEYTSPLMMALNTRKTASIDRFIAAVAQYSQVSPQLLDLVNMDAAMRDYANYIDVPTDILNSEEEVQRTRDERAQQQAQAQQKAEQQAEIEQLAKYGPDVLKKLNETVPQDNSMLANLSEGLMNSSLIPQ